MIVDTILGFVTSVLGGIFDLLPSWSFLDALGLSDVHPGSLAGYYAGPFDGFLPIHEVVSMLITAFTTLLAAYATYKVANWVWRHIPDIGGFGPGAG